MYQVDVHHGIAETTDGVRIAYQVSGQGPAIVLCHAMANDHSMFDPHRDVFSAANTLITFDQRGSGDSDHPPFDEGPDSQYMVEAFGSDLKAVLDKLYIERASVLGFSMGAVAALWFTTQHPDRVERLILVPDRGEVVLSIGSGAGATLTGNITASGQPQARARVCVSRVRQLR